MRFPPLVGVDTRGGPRRASRTPCRLLCLALQTCECGGLFSSEGMLCERTPQRARTWTRTPPPRSRVCLEPECTVRWCLFTPGGYKPSVDKLSTAPRHRNTAQINTVIRAGADPRERRLGGGRWEKRGTETDRTGHWEIRGCRPKKQHLETERRL